MNERRNRLQAVIFDWAGTTVDYGSRAPTQVFCEIFRRTGIPITPAEARGPMGRAKRDHIAQILALPRVTELWRAQSGHAPRDADIDRLYSDFLPLQKETLAQHCDIIPGVIEVITECRRRGMRIGSSTGYTRELMEIVEPLVRTAGYQPDVTICADDVLAGRPAPWMLFQAAERLNAYPVNTIVAVDDTPVGIEAGRNAGVWTVAVTKTGNSLGLSEAEVDALTPADLSARLTAATENLICAGAHFVIDSVADLLPVLDQIELRIASSAG